MKISSAVAGLLAPFLLLGCASTAGGRLGLTEDGRLVPCGLAANCVSSDEARGRHRIEPLAVGEDPAAAWRTLTAYLEDDSSFEIKVQEQDYLRAVARTRVFRFVDDVEFRLRPESGEIAMRSGSRLGFSDLGKNRRRLETLRRSLADKKVLGAAP